ncbi:MAG: hypothetical protein GXX99_02520, partial [Clostridiales bacterium]|nr:hypothetical protein [Clostridiales bacterium]
MVFSLLFFAAFAVYLFFGIYIIQVNPRAGLNKLFLAVCISLCFWSLGFAVANTAPDLETCLLWRRVSAIGWGSIYSLLLHFSLVLTRNKCTRERRALCWLLHLPAVISLYAFALYKPLADTQYHLVNSSNGWVNISVKDGWTLFFYAYYISYVLACLFVVFLWRRRACDPQVRKQANALLLSIAAAMLLGSLTDVILSAALGGRLPQMAPIFTLIPVA